MNRTQTESYIDALNPRVFTYIQYADYADRYPTHTVHEFPQAFYDEMRTASAGLFRIFCKAAEVLQNAPDDFARAMDLPREMLPYLRIPNIAGSFPCVASIHVKFVFKDVLVHGFIRGEDDGFFLCLFAVMLAAPKEQDTKDNGKTNKKNRHKTALSAHAFNPLHKGYWHQRFFLQSTPRRCTAT